MLIISGTNRKDSRTSIVANAALNLAKSRGIDAKLIDLSLIDNDFIQSGQYNPDNIPKWLQNLQDDVIIPSDKFIVVSPEYNGSFPGYLKLFLDTLSVRKAKESFGLKKISLIGVAAGRAGNLRGLDQLTNIFLHLGAVVLPGSLPISGITKFLDQDNVLSKDINDLLDSTIDKLVAA